MPLQRPRRVARGGNGAGQTADRPRQGAPIGLFYTWWRGDPLPALAPLPDFAVEAPADERRTAALTGLNSTEVRTRLEAGHQPYVARLGDTVVASGWSASRAATIGSAGLAFHLPPGNRYLWDFVTLPAWRGRGFYSRLLQALLVQERSEAARFWIGHDQENVASARGIVRAGFQVVGDLSVLPNGGLALWGRGEAARSRAAAILLGVALTV